MKILIDLVWGYHILLLILFVGLIITIKSKFLQVRDFFKWIKSPFLKARSTDGISPFQALSTALAGTIGTGNIAGVSLAIAVGGAGSIFWMWISAFFGMMTVFAEVVLSVKFAKNGLGAISYIEKVGKKKILAFIYAFACLGASLTMGNMAQANSVSSAINNWGVPRIIIGLSLAIIVFFLACGGIKRVSSLTEKLVPFMTVFFFAFSIYTLFKCRDRIPTAIAEIFESAFSFKAGLGGGLFIAVKTGISRGVFTNEAGLGLSTMAYSSVKNKTPKNLAYLGVFGVFMDTIVMCSITGLCVLVSTSQRTGDFLVRDAFENSLGNYGLFSVNMCMALFGFATMTATSYYGKIGLKFISKDKLTFLFPYLACVFAFLGAVMPLAKVFEICDIFNAMLAIPNLIALILLRKHFMNELK